MQIHVIKNEEGVDEWTMIELQGTLENDDRPLDGKILGNLMWRKDTKEAILIIGTHMLEGKFHNLEKPLLVAVPHSEDQTYVVNAVIRRKLLFKLRPKPIVTKGLGGHLMIVK